MHTCIILYACRLHGAFEISSIFVLVDSFVLVCEVLVRFSDVA